MRAPADPHPATQNRLLSSLTGRKYKELLSSFRPVTFETAQVLYQPGDSINYALFPLTTMLSVIAERQDGRSVEIAIVGRDGLVGMPALLGHPAALYRIIAQLPGSALRVPAAVVREAAKTPGPFQSAIHSYTMALIVELSRATVCHCFHSLEQRLARWILRTHDYALADEFPMQQDFMAQMLAARRVAITQTAHRLRRDGVIDYRRGRLLVLDRAALEQRSCDCYRVVREAFAQLWED